MKFWIGHWYILFLLSINQSRSIILMLKLLNPNKFQVSPSADRAMRWDDLQFVGIAIETLILRNFAQIRDRGSGYWFTADERAGQKREWGSRECSCLSVRFVISTRRALWSFQSQSRASQILLANVVISSSQLPLLNHSTSIKPTRASSGKVSSVRPTDVSGSNPHYCGLSQSLWLVGEPPIISTETIPTSSRSVAVVFATGELWVTELL